MANFSLLAKLGVDTKAFQTGLGKAKGSVGKFKGALSGLSGVLGTIGLSSMAREAINLGSKISDMAIQLNIGTTELQVLEFAARKAGVETGIMERAIRNVQLRTQQGIEGNKRYAEAYQTLGLSIEEVSKMKAEEKLEAIAKASQEATDKQAAYNAVAAILGERAGPKMMEILQDLSDKGYKNLENAAKSAGEVMDEQTIAKMDAAADKIESVKRQITVLVAQILGPMMSGFTILKEGLGGIGDTIGTTISKFGSFFGFLASSLGSIIQPAVLAFESLALAIAAAGLAATGNFADAKDLMTKAKETGEKAFEELKNIPSEISEEYKRANEDMIRANKALDKDMDQRAKNIETAFKDMFSGLVDESNKTGKKINENISGEGGTGTGGTGTGGTDDIDEKNELEKEAEAIKKKELELLEAQASGQDELASKLKKEIELRKEALRIAENYEISLEEALNLAKGLADQEGDKQKRKTSKRSELTRSDLQRAANKAAKEQGIRFERMADGTFQQFVEGRKGRKFTEEELQKGLGAKMEKDKSENYLKEIAENTAGRTVNE